MQEKSIYINIIAFLQWFIVVQCLRIFFLLLCSSLEVPVVLESSVYLWTISKTQKSDASSVGSPRQMAPLLPPPIPIHPPLLPGSRVELVTEPANPVCRVWGKVGWFFMLSSHSTLVLCSSGYPWPCCVVVGYIPNLLPLFPRYWNFRHMSPCLSYWK